MPGASVGDVCKYEWKFGSSTARIQRKFGIKVDPGPVPAGTVVVGGVVEVPLGGTELVRMVVVVWTMECSCRQRVVFGGPMQNRQYGPWGLTPNGKDLVRWE